MRVRRSVLRWFSVVVAVGFVVPLVATTVSPVGATTPSGLPPGLRPAEVNVSKDVTRRFGEPQIAVNPKNPNNLVWVGTDSGFTSACQPASAGSPCELEPSAFGPQPRGFFETSGFDVNGVFVSFDRGKTWTQVDVAGLHPAGHPELHGQGDGMVTAGPDGTFYLGWDALNWNTPANPIPNAGIAVSKSTDGGLTWSVPVLTGTPVDRPWITADLSTGMIYEVSSGRLGRRADGDASHPDGLVNDRWLVASPDGVTWTAPQRLGGTDGVNEFSGASASHVSAANGVVATTFRSADATACAFFVGGAAPCSVFQTSTDAGATWIRHRAPVPSTVASQSQRGGIQVAADPSTPGHYAVAAVNDAGTQFLVYQTLDAGNTWTGPSTVAQDATKTHFHPWLAYSPRGVLGLMWQTNEGASWPILSPYSVWAATSDDGGSTFSQPLRISTADSPTPQSGPFNGFTGDDLSYIALSGQDAFVVWCDWRPGERQGFFSAIKLQAFNHAT